MRLACAQIDVLFGDPEANVRRVVERLSGADLTVFPECALTGYAVESADAAAEIALSDVDRLVQPIQASCDALGVHAVVGYAARRGDHVLNVAGLFAPGVPRREYAKTHLPELGLDRYVEPGHELPVFDTVIGRIGILVCFDLRVPEAARTLALRGADLIVLPTNWPEGANVAADHIAIARAAENRVFLAACNRVGTENGFRFIGRSSITAPSGKVLAKAGESEETIVADVELAEARQKQTIVVPGVYETNSFTTRQPAIYER